MPSDHDLPAFVLLHAYVKRCVLWTDASLHVAQAAMWQMTFVAAPETIQELQNGLKLDEQVLRYAVLKQPQRPSLPSTYAVAKQAMQRLVNELGVDHESLDQEMIAPKA